MIGNPVKKIQKEELQMAKVSRKSMHFSRDMVAGEVVQKKDIVLKRPGSGLYITLLHLILGRKLNSFVFHLGSLWVPQPLGSLVGYVERRARKKKKGENKGA